MNAFLAEGFLGLQLPGDFDPREFKFKTSYFILLSTANLNSKLPTSYFDPLQI
jgi:hypothetical protein